jgi:hypothetical protein
MILSLESLCFFNIELYGKPDSRFLKKFLRLSYSFSRYNKSCFLGKQIALSIVFLEDMQRKRNKNAAQNSQLVRKIVLNLLKKNKGKESLRSKRLKAGWNNDFLLQLITNYNAFALMQISTFPFNQ